MSENPPPIVFSDGKAPEAMRTIGEVSKALGIRQHVLRYWEDQFPMLRPLKRSGGRRYYRPEDIQMVATIDRLVHHEGYTLRGARLAIAGKGGAAERPVPGLKSSSTTTVFRATSTIFRPMQARSSSPATLV